MPPPAQSVSPDSVVRDGGVIAPWRTLIQPETLDVDRGLVAQIREKISSNDAAVESAYEREQALHIDATV